MVQIKLGQILTLMLLIIGCTSEKKFEYYENGGIKSSEELSNGLRNGFYIEYYEDGTIKTKEYWENGRLNGAIEEFYPNGKIKVNAKVENYKMIFNEEYYESGRIKQKQLFDSTGKIFEIEVYKESGLRDSLVHPIFGIYNGDTINYGDTAIFAAKLYNVLSPLYRNGTMIITSEFDSSHVFKDTLSTVLPNSELQYEYSFIADKRGKNSIKGAFVFTKKLPDGFSNQTLYEFEYGYYILR